MERTQAHLKDCTMAMLRVRNLTKAFGGLTAVNAVDFDVGAGEILSVIGPNGAGKSTLFKLITAFLRPTQGRITFLDEEISGLPPHVVARRGIIRTFQETVIFREMTALQNVVLAHHLQCRASSWGLFLNSPRARGDEARFRKSAEDILEYLGLGALKDEVALNLPHGHLRALGIAVALAAKPRLLLLDEPFTGMNPDETDEAVTVVQGLRDRGLTIMLVEHDMRAVMRISDRIIVLNFGTKIAEGTPVAIQRNDAVIEAYLGREDEEIGM
jgi:branched-chain amino acid transport system ATP-binding protein